MSGPLTGVRIIELAGIGPGPFAAMMLADMGADIIRVERAGSVRETLPENIPFDLLIRGRRSIGVDLKSPEGIEVVMRLVESADALIEGFRPGVTERLGLGPNDCLARNPRLVYGRMTGWGQEGPYSQAAGHDINYIALAGSLAHLGRAGEKPTPPINLVGDFGGGGMFLAFGVACALFEATRSGEGQVVDAAMVDGSAVLMSMFVTWPGWGERGTNLLDTGAPFYDTYETKDGKYISIGSLEPQFYAELVSRLELGAEFDLATQMDPRTYEMQRSTLTALFLTKTRDEWNAILEHSDACYAPVLEMSEAAEHPHLKARGTYVEEFGVTQPAPAPRFSRTPGAIQGPPAWPGQHTDAALSDWGFNADELSALRESGAIR
ncbi:putative acyl-CoA transferase/carnitine dehydratase [Actinobacteria bacterium IMCC26256]|nr:putative acyl-CoA transferase/carnitine dehydratase [Actinobacteria bacterium IMCC26256]